MNLPKPTSLPNATESKADAAASPDHETEATPKGPSPVGKVELIQTFVPRLDALGSETGIDLNCRAPAGHSEISPINNFSDGHGETILVIDDLLSIRNIFQVLLKTYGYKSLVAEDGPAGLACYREHQNLIRVVIIDMRMPGLQGIEVIHALRLINPDVRVIAMSGFFNTPMEVNLDADRLAFLQKPMIGRELQAALQRVTRLPPSAGGKAHSNPV